MTMLAPEPAHLLPDPPTVGRRAAQILCAVERHPMFDRLRSSTLAYPDCWATFSGYRLPLGATSSTARRSARSRT